MTDSSDPRRRFATLRRSTAGVAVAAATAFGMAPASAQMYGPRQFWPAPLGTDVLTVAGISYSKVGGGTYADGVFNDNQQLWSSLGATIGGSPWSRARLALTAGGVVASNDSSPNGWLMRLQFQQTW